VLLHVARELALGKQALVVGLGLDEAVVVVERELRVHGDDPVDAHDRVDSFARVERVLDVIGGGREPVAQEVLEQELAEPAACLRRTQCLLEPRQVLGPLEHLRRRLVDLAEPLVDLVRRLAGVLEPTVDLRIELGEPAVHRLGNAQQPTVDLGRPFCELRAPVGAEVAQEPREPHERGGKACAEDQDEDDVCHRADER
jgi:hypothetical protein